MPSDPRIGRRGFLAGIAGGLAALVCGRPAKAVAVSTELAMTGVKIKSIPGLSDVRSMGRTITAEEIRLMYERLQAVSVPTTKWTIVGTADVA